MDFISAVKALREGKCVGIRRSDWSIADYWVIKDGYSMKWKIGLDTVHPVFADYLNETWELIPKPKVKKVVEGWVNVYDLEGRIRFSQRFSSSEGAMDARSSSFIGTYLGDPLYISHEYEVEE